MVRALDEQLMQEGAVLTAVAVVDGPPLSAFEQAVLSVVDGARSNGAVARALGVRLEDLRIALGPLLVHGRLEGSAVRPPLVVPRAITPGLVAAPASGDGFAVPPSTDTAVKRARVVDDRHGAAALHARALRALRSGDVVEARTLAEQARAAAPAVTLHLETIQAWDAFVFKHVGAGSAADKRALAVRAWVKHSPQSGWAQLALAEVHLAEGHAEQAVVAADTAGRLANTQNVVDGALVAAAHRFGKDARLAARRNKVRALFGAAPVSPSKRRAP